jgi:putative oxidoreductase
MYASMNAMDQTRSLPKSPLKTLIADLRMKLELVPLSIVQLLARASLATIFWRAGQAKLANWNLTVQLFANEYKVPVLPPEIAAQMALSFELGCSVLLVLGLFSRLAVLPLIGMTTIIQLFVYPESWNEHIVWFTLLLFILIRGAGVVSLDALIARSLFKTRG